MFAQAANALTILRIVLTPIFALCVWRTAPNGAGWPAGGLYILIAGSDFLDGRVARYWGTVSARGRSLDHAADIFFIVSSLATYTWLGVTPWWIPAVITLSFAVYVGHSVCRSNRPTLIRSRVGHIAGILNYTLVGILVANNTLELRLIPPTIMTGLFWLVPIYSGIAIIEHLQGVKGVRG